MKHPFKWEPIEIQENVTTYRAMVEGGWLVNHVIAPCGQEALLLMTTTFVPDSQHRWEIGEDAPKVNAVG